jgi:hypothetical protein
MTRLTIKDARVLLSTLEGVRRAALRTAPGGPDALECSPPMAELRCLLAEAARIPDIETHLRTVGALALRDVAARVYTRKWDIGTRVFPHGFERLLEPDARMQIGDAYPFLLIGDIDWSEDLAHLPGEVWITHGETRQLQGSLRERARAAIAARYPVRAIAWTVQTAASLAGYED